MEHYSELYSHENKVSEAAFISFQPLFILEELDEELTFDDLRKVIDDLATCKAPGKDEIPWEVI